MLEVMHTRSYDCPSSGKSFYHVGQYQSTNHEAECPHCIQSLQWGEPQQSAGHGTVGISACLTIEWILRLVVHECVGAEPPVEEVSDVFGLPLLAGKDR